MLVRIGNRIVNTDNVTVVNLREGGDVRMTFNVTASGDYGHEPVYAVFKAAEAAALWAFLVDRAANVLAINYGPEPQATSKCLACGAEVPGEPQTCPECGADYVPF